MSGAVRRSIWPPILVAFVLVAAAFVARAIYNAPNVPLLADNDDAMRLTMVRDLLAGQAWYDPVQHRLNTPYGAEMHWSRLVDLPIAALMVLFRPLGEAMAETVALHLWPLILLLCLLLLSVLITLRLVGRDGLLPALVLPALSLATLAEFVPGRIDHHSVQILLTLAMLYCGIEALTRTRFAIGAGVAAATSLAVGVEGVPSVAAAILTAGLTWVLVPGRSRMLRGFGLSFGAATLIFLVATIAPERWLQPACDAISPVYAALAAGVGIGFTVLSLIETRQTLTRLVLGLAAGGAVLAAMVLLFPQCLRGPYAAVDPWLVEHWISRIREAMPLWESIVANPVYTIAAAFPPLFALAVTIHRIAFGGRENRGAWLVYGLFLVFAVVVMLVQIRGSRMAAELAMPAGALLIVMARRRYVAAPGPLPIAGLAAAWTAFTGIAVGVLVNLAFLAVPGYSAAEAERDQSGLRGCLVPAAFDELAKLPARRAMTYVDLGAHVLAHTPHEVVAAPYHRNEDGVRDTFQFFTQPLQQARTILDERGIGLVIICPHMPETQGIGDDPAADSFVTLYSRGELPPWLAERSGKGSALKVYEVAPR